MASTCWVEITVALKPHIWYIIGRQVIITCSCPSVGRDVDSVEHVSVPLEFRGDHTVTGGMNDSFGYDVEERVSRPPDGVEYHGFCDVGYDSGLDAVASTFTPMSGDG